MMIFFPSLFNIRPSELLLRGPFLCIRLTTAPAISPCGSMILLHGPLPELAQAPATWPPDHRSRVASSGKRPRRPGKSGITHSQQGCEVSRNPGDSGKDRRPSSRSGRPEPGSEIFVSYACLVVFASPSQYAEGTNNNFELG